MDDKCYITSAEDLITSHEQTRIGFIEAALSKSHKAKPYIEQAKTLKSLASRASSPIGLLDIKEIQKRPAHGLRIIRQVIEVFHNCGQD